MKKPLFVGSGVALVTPFKEDFSVDFEKLGELVEYHCNNLTDAIIVIGTTGEASTMSFEERKEVVKFVVMRVNKRVPVIAGAGSNDTMQAVKFCKEYESLGVDGLLVVTPYYNKGNFDGLYKHFLTISRNVKTPIILYNVPGRTGVNLPIEIIKMLSKEENIVGIKEASGDISYTTEIARVVPELPLYSGNDDITLPILSIGGVGTISVLANIKPRIVHNLVYSYLNGEREKAIKFQLGYNGLVKELFSEVNPVPVKKAMEILNLCSSLCRLPLGEMQERSVELLKKALEEVNQ